MVDALILALELKPRRVTRLPLRSAHDATDAAVTRGGLAGTLRAAATGVDGISSAAVTVRRRRARVTATSAARSRSAEVLGVRQTFLCSLDSVLAIEARADAVTAVLIASVRARASRPRPVAGQAFLLALLPGPGAGHLAGALGGATVDRRLD